MPFAGRTSTRTSLRRGRLAQPFLHEGIGYTAVQAAPGRRDALTRPKVPLAPLEIAYLTRDEAGRTGNRAWEGTEEWQRLAAEEIARLLASGATLAGAAGPERLEPRHVAVLTRTNRQAQEIQEHLRELGIPSVLQGDRTVFEAPEGEVEATMEVARHVMEKSPEPALKLKVPLKVDARSGDNWEAAH